MDQDEVTEEEKGDDDGRDEDDMGRGRKKNAEEGGEEG
jgi:hypothetical protein